MKRQADSILNVRDRSFALISRQAKLVLWLLLVTSVINTGILVALIVKVNQVAVPIVRYLENH